MMDSAKDLGKRGVRTLEAGVDAVTKAAGRMPRDAGTRPRGRDRRADGPHG